MEDKVLKKLVEDELQYQPSVDAADIGVTVERGIVRLTGHVATYAEKAAVENAVRRVKGVRGYVEDGGRTVAFISDRGDEPDLSRQAATALSRSLLGSTRCASTARSRSGNVSRRSTSLRNGS